MISRINHVIFLKRLFLLVPLLLIFSGQVNLRAQEPPPRPIRITATGQVLSFGAFYHGLAGGTVTILPNSSRSSSGDVVLLNLGYTFSSAMFEVHAHPGTVISILNSLPAVLNGTPSGSMTMNVGSSSPPAPFVSTVHFNVPIYLYIGGVLTVGSTAANPPGSYTGTFDITLVRE